MTSYDKLVKLIDRVDKKITSPEKRYEGNVYDVNKLKVQIAALRSNHEEERDEKKD